MKIITVGHPTLRESVVPVNNINATFVNQINDMFKLMYNSNGIGLAAPQVNIKQKFFIVDTRETDEKLVCINPKIVSRLNQDVEMDEGCLSIPGVYGPVRRPKSVVVEFIDLDGKPQTLKAKGLLARVIQHEYDHLEGILFIDHLSEEYLKKISKELEEIQRKNREKK